MLLWLNSSLRLYINVFCRVDSLLILIDDFPPRYFRLLSFIFYASKIILISLGEPKNIQLFNSKRINSINLQHVSLLYLFHLNKFEIILLPIISRANERNKYWIGYTQIILNVIVYVKYLLKGLMPSIDTMSACNQLCFLSPLPKIANIHGSWSEHY